ncbi:hypothetical protein ACFVT5_41235 [Streptomyces sp. NPDC058001]|uniref:hypothetical protein n=1 Tax=Streptomyces sp. NPDC058001 TaxID=3346300 RepID=UPI0036E36762
MLKVIAYTLAGAFAAGWALLIIMGNFVWDKEDQSESPAADASPSATTTPITWEYKSTTCRDGWDSPSIGRPGACSHHGGVVALYTADFGELNTYCPPRFQPKTMERAHELADETGWVACDTTESEPTEVGAGRR